MASLQVLMFFFAIASMGWSPAEAEDLLAQSGSVRGITREPRSLRKKKLCRRYGICDGFQGGYQQQGFHGGQQGGYPGQYPPINIAVSQSQSAANGAEGGYSNGYYPNNHQYNGAHPYQGNFGGYPHRGGYGGFPQQGYRPGNFENGHGSYNNQFNGNYYGPGGPIGGGYGFRPHGPYYDENPDDDKPIEEHQQDDVNSGSGVYNDYNQGSGYQGQGQDYAAAGAFAVAGRKND